MVALAMTCLTALAHLLSVWSPNGTKLPMSAVTGQLCFVYQTLVAAKTRLCVRYRGATEQKDVCHTHPYGHGSTYVDQKQRLWALGADWGGLSPCALSQDSMYFLLKPAEV